MPKIWKPEKEEEKKDIEKEQSYCVVKANELIQRSRYDMTVQQNKIVLYLISKIKPDDTGEEEYSFSIREFCKVCNIDYDSGKNYELIKEQMKVIGDKSIWVKREDGRGETLVRWFNTVDVVYVDNKETGKFIIKFHERMLPYLFYLRDRLIYTKYALSNILTMKSKYGIQLYEILKSYEKIDGDIVFTIEEIKHLLVVNEEEREKYKRYPDFRRYVIERAINEINDCSDIRVGYMPIKINGKRAIDSIKFTVKTVKNAEKEIREEIKRAKLSEERKAAVNRRVRRYLERERKIEEEEKKQDF